MAGEARTQRQARQIADRRLRSRPDLVARLQEQIRFIERSARAFDEGDQAEARRLATSIRVLVHETAASHSILGQLGLLNVIDFVDTAGLIDSRNLLPTHGLFGMQITMGPSGSVVYKALLGEGPRPVRMIPFRDWWADPVTRIPNGELRFSRRQYILG